MSLYSALITAALTLIGVLLILKTLALLSHNEHVPGLIGSKLEPCPERPNCVNSEYQKDSAHYIHPIQIALSTDNQQALRVIEQAITDLGGVLEESNNVYIRATFKSKIFGFVDDLEVRLDMQGKILHIRSASRVGWSDGGMNRKRVQNLREQFQLRSD